jgi:hypothetical protein
VNQGGSATSTISINETGTAQTVNLSASGLPSGASATFNPASLSATGTSTMTISTASTTPPGTYSITVTGTGTSATHSTTFALTVNSPGGGGIVNGSFETGTFSGWTTSGAATSIVSPGRTDSFAAQGGRNTPTNGNSSIAQTFTAPSGTSHLTFWYNVSCPDTVQFDWATATLRDNTSSTTRTVLARTCNNNGTWVQVSATITAGHSYTLTLTNRDDNFTGDPTFTKFDDASLS